MDGSIQLRRAPTNWHTDPANIGLVLLHLRPTCSNIDEIDNLIRFVTSDPAAYEDEFLEAMAGEA